MVVLFDIDGTLIDGGGAGRRAFEKATATLLGREGLLDGLRLDGMTDQLIARAALCRARPGRAPDDRDVQELLGAYLARIDAEVAASERYRVLPGAAELVSRLAGGGARLGLCTGNLRGGARAKLGRAGLFERFEFGGFGEDAAQREEILEVALTRASAAGPIDRSQVWVVGDTPRDYEAARASRVRVLLVATGRHGLEELAALGADGCVRSLEDPVAAAALAG